MLYRLYATNTSSTPAIFIYNTFLHTTDLPEVTRILFNTCGMEPTMKKIPSCEDHYDVLNSMNLGAFQQTSPGDGHGPMHVQVTGELGLEWGRAAIPYHL